MSDNDVNTLDDAEMADCDGEKVVTMMDVLQEQQDFEDDADAVLGASDEKNCTFSKGYIKRQAIYACLTCCNEAKTDPKKRAGVCLACSLNCHENHELVELYTKRNFRCDCGNSKFDQPCQFTPDKTELNTENLYNQNFSGLYCVCNRPYPDPDATFEDEMIQCIICEDWLHSMHLEATVPGHEQYSEMICKNCMKKNEFLHDYTEYVVNIEDAEVEIDKDNSIELGNGIQVEKMVNEETEDNINISSNEIKVNEILSENINVEKNTSVYNNNIKNTEPEINSDIMITDSDDKLINFNTDNSDDIKSKSEDTFMEKSKLSVESEKNEPLNEPDINVIIDNAIRSNLKENLEQVETSIEPEIAKSIAESDDSKSMAEAEAHSSITVKKCNSELSVNAEVNNSIISDLPDSNISTDIPTSTLNESESLELAQATGKDQSNMVPLQNEIKINETKDSGNEEKSFVDTDMNTNKTASIEISIEQSDNTRDGDTLEKATDELFKLTGDEKEIEYLHSGIQITHVSKDIETECNIDSTNNAATSLTDKNDTNGEIEQPLEKDIKRKLDVQEDMITKRAKLEDCMRKKGKKVYKGATFWPQCFRQKLCTCSECLTMYKDLSVMFLVDPEDTVAAYEFIGKEKSDGGSASQYEKGLEALSSLDRVQQINALTEFNKMRDKLLDYLKSFKDRKEVVKEEDIRAFFAGMKPRREPDGVYFCR